MVILTTGCLECAKTFLKSKLGTNLNSVSIFARNADLQLVSTTTKQETKKWIKTTKICNLTFIFAFRLCFSDFLCRWNRNIKTNLNNLPNINLAMHRHQQGIVRVVTFACNYDEYISTVDAFFHPMITTKNSIHFVRFSIFWKHSTDVGGLNSSRILKL